jgi:capsular polysaccharide biosynthesis protein
MGILEAYSISDEDIIDLTIEGEVVVKELLFIYNAYDNITRPIVELSHYFGNNDNYATWSLEYSPLIKKRFLKNKKIVGNRKLFISRSHDDKRLRQYSEILNKVFNGYPLNKEETLTFNRLPPEQYGEYADRTMTIYDEKRLEKFFKNAGYEIVDPGQSIPSIFDQAELYNSASHIVALQGAGLANCCFANSNVKVLILNNTDSYTFPHFEIVKSLGISCVQSPPKMIKSNRSYNAREIFESVKRDYPEFLL